MKIDIKEILTLPTTVMAALTLASGILLFSPETLLATMYMTEFRNSYGFIIGIVFIVSLSILIVNLIYTIAKVISHTRAKKHFYATAEKRLRKLNNYQKTIIFALSQEDNRTLPLPLHDGAVLELEQNKMIGKASSQYMVSDLNNALFPYLLHPWVSDELNNKPELLTDFQTASSLQYKKNINQHVEYW